MFETPNLEEKPLGLAEYTLYLVSQGDLAEEDRELVEQALEHGLNAMGDAQTRLSELREAWWQTNHPELTSKGQRKAKVKELQEASQKESEPAPYEALVGGFHSQLEREREIRKLSQQREAVPKELFRDSAAFNMQLTAFILENGGDAEMCAEFWRVLANSAPNDRRYVEALKRGVVSQVASHKLLESVGHTPELSTPEEDAFDAIDLWGEGDEAREAVQVKASGDKFEIVEVETITPPCLITRDGEELNAYNTPDFESIRRFAIKAERYAERKGQKVRAFFMIVPRSKFDADTGEPTADLVAEAQEYFGVSDDLALAA